MAPAKVINNIYANSANNFGTTKQHIRKRQKFNEPTRFLIGSDKQLPALPDWMPCPHSAAPDPTALSERGYAKRSEDHFERQ